MNIIIAGNGNLGSALVEQLSAEGCNITVIDTDARVLEEARARYDVMSIRGNCASMDVLIEAGVRSADLLIAVAPQDEVNLLCCTTAHGLNPKLHTIARIRTPEYTEQVMKMREVFALSFALNPEKQVATEIERLLKYPGFLRRDTFAKGRTEIVELRVEEKSKLCDLPLSALNAVVGCRVLVCSVIRDGNAITPKGSFVLSEGDRVFVTAPTENLTVLLKNLGIITRPVRRVILCGGGRISYYLATLLRKDKISVCIIDPNSRRCRELAEMLPKVSVICGDATDRMLLESEGIADADALVSLTGMDELNMIISLYGLSQGVPQVITKLERTDNRRIVDSLSLGSIVCSKDLSYNTIIRYVRAMQNQSGAALTVHAIADGQAEAVEFAVDGFTDYCGVPLKKLKLREDVLIVSITHEATTEIPGGDSVFMPGDTVVVVTGKRGSLRCLNDIFA
jgi:trk system potassium uptake protein TrkA